MRRCQLVVALLCVSAVMSGRAAASDGDTLSQTLRAVDVKGMRVRSHLHSIGGKSVIDMELMRQMPQILGNADPMRYAQTLPGVQTGSEYDAGLHIHGSDNSHNQVGIGGVPIYNVAHMFGFFSIFNATHYTNMQLSKSAVAPDAPNRLGGVVDMMVDERPATRPGGDISVGPMSSQATLRIPTGRRSSLSVSARAAYLNLLYSHWLKAGDEKLGYSFSDYNLTYLFKPDDRNLFWVDAYYGGDNVNFTDGDYGVGTSLKWSNLMAAVHWRHNGRGMLIEQCAYYTRYDNRFRIEQTALNGQLPSYISDIGYKAKVSSGRAEAGLDVVWHDIMPQDPQMDGLLQHTQSGVQREHSLETSLWFGWKQPLADGVTLDAGLRSNVYASGDGTFLSADPGVSLSWDVAPSTRLTLQGGIKHQYLFKAGFSDVGLPTEFWFSSGYGRSPQYSYNGSLSAETFVCSNAYRISAEVYYKRLFHQMEYSGNVFDFIYSDYSLDDVLLCGNGYNYGANIMLEKRKGALTGWLAYSYGKARRHFPGTKDDGTFPAAHERVHELNVVATYRLSDRWNFGATLVAASGTPYTKAERFYVLNNYIVADYGPHNGGRVPPYVRLDISAGYAFRMRGRHKSGINVSLCNVNMRENCLFYRLKVSEDGMFAYRPFSFLMRMMPSVSYYYSF